MRPKAAKEYRPIELKLGIKSSLPRVKSAVALIIALWKSCGQKGEVSYSKQISDSIRVDDQTFTLLKDYFGPLINNETAFRAKLDENPLLRSQIESLKVAFELIWKIGVFEFEDTRKAFNIEREGQVRYTKKVRFTKNIDVIDLIIKPDEDAFKQVLCSWIMGTTPGTQYAGNETDLVRGLTLISEEAVYRLRLDDDNDLKFRNQGIYSNIKNGTEQVDTADYKEKMGPLRILHSIVSENLNLFLKKQGDSISLRDTSKVQDLKEYTKRVEEYLSLNTISLDVVTQDQQETEEEEGYPDIGHPYNRIIFGAPGTGKSYILEEQRVPFRDNFERVTFHPNYSYAQFVGAYKPKPKYRANSDEYVSYEFVAGPFLRMWARATKNPGEKFLLIIEEINRSNVAGVFGDVFQLLDRKDGFSEYAISTSEEMRDYLINEHGFDTAAVSKIRIPNNLYIWATMNSADQGVFPVDAAFKRRWNFEYVGIDQFRDKIKGKMITLKPYGEVEWDALRVQINNELTSAALNVNEDKLLGPFFLSDEELTSDRIDEVFKSKLLMYLFEDVLKHRKKAFFLSKYNTLSKLLGAYDEGENVFDFDVRVNDGTVEYNGEAQAPH